MRKKRALIVVLIISITLFVLSCSDLDITGDAAIGSTHSIPSENSTNPIILFCPRDNCSANLVFLIDNSEKIHCAFFDLDVPEIIEALERKNASVVVDGDNYKYAAGKIKNLKKDSRKAYMHNKFCVFDDGIVWTGSFNPTLNDDRKNNNNVVIIQSEYLSGNYEKEFQELWNSEFGKGSRVEHPIIMLNEKKIENYFCPEDWCANKVINALGYANESIYFMTFSFTHDKIGDALAEKHRKGIDVKGIFEKKQGSNYSEYSKLKEAGMNVSFDKNPFMMHHKVFVIDRKIVVTGSFNPSKNGDMENDENILIIYDPKIADLYIRELEFIREKPDKPA